MYNVSTARYGSSAPSSAAAPAAPPEPVRQPAFRVHYDRAALALAGVMALAALVLGLPLAAFGPVSWWLPAGGLLVAAGATASLRALALRDRRRRVEAAFRAAMGTGRQPAPRSAPQPEWDQPEWSQPANDQPAVQEQEAPVFAVPPVRKQRETVLFDAERTPGTASKPAAAAATVTTASDSSGRPLTAADLRRAALDLAAQSAPARTAGPPKTSATPWEPVAVPKPIYVQAPVAQRQAPEPLVPAQTPKSTGRTSIRAGAAAAAAPAAADPAPATGKINLDHVLQRRRA